MLASSRTIYGREFQVTPAWLWLLQRMSAILLGPLVAVHVWLPPGGHSAIIGFALLLLVLIHGYGGLRRLFNRKPAAKAAFTLALAWCVVVLSFGLITVFAAF